MSIPIPDQGRHPGVPPPVGLAFPVDPSTNLNIYLAVDIPEPYLARDTATRDFHWSIHWTVGISQNHECCRLLSLETYNNEHLVYYGAFTKVIEAQTQSRNKAFPLGFATLKQRKLLEQIASETDVMLPDGDWNCQNWVKSVLATASARGIFDAEVVRRAVSSAEALPPVLRKIPQFTRSCSA